MVRPGDTSRTTTKMVELKAVDGATFQWRHGYAELKVPRERLLDTAHLLKADGFDYKNDPARMSQHLTYKLADLPKKGWRDTPVSERSKMYALITSRLPRSSNSCTTSTGSFAHSATSSMDSPAASRR